jgi:protein-L-isoaspartate(D-aspartate) O-methyltransferase
VARRVGLVVLLTVLVLGCVAHLTSRGQGPSAAGDEAALRETMVKQVASQGVTDLRVLAAMRQVPRHLFVPPTLRGQAYDNRPLPVGERQTISQPYIVALMTELARVEPGEKVLEVGTGSGYQAAVLAQMGARVYTIEIISTLAERAKKTLDALGYRTIQYRVGDGYRGWPEAAPFGAILVTAAPDHLPQPLTDQLAVGGRLVIPVGASPEQKLLVVTRTEAGTRREEIIPVIFVPMTGEAERRPR